MRLDTHTLNIYVEDEDGNEIEIPGRFEVCNRCDGKGTHVNPSIDGHGLSREDFDEDPQFEEDYFAGVYDIKCLECKGLRVVLVINEHLATEEQKEAYQAELDADYDDRREREAELRWGY